MNKFNKKQANKKKDQNSFGTYFEFVNGEKSTKFVDIINRAKYQGPDSSRKPVNTSNLFQDSSIKGSQNKDLNFKP